MRVHEWGDPDQPTVILLHGGGLGWWAYRDVALPLAGAYHVVVPSIQGNGDAADEPFESIQASAAALIRWIDETYQGRVHAIGGLSLGAQIAVAVLCQRPAMATHAILESALIFPLRSAGLIKPMAAMSYGLIRHRWFARLQAKQLQLPDALFELYFDDTRRMSKQTLLQTLQSNASFAPGASLAQVQAKTLVIVGEKELPVMRRSAMQLAADIPAAKLWVANGMRHGELSLRHPAFYAERVLAWLAT